MGYDGNLNTQHTKKPTFVVVVGVLGNIMLGHCLHARHKKAPFMRNDPNTFPTLAFDCMRYHCALDKET